MKFQIQVRGVWGGTAGDWRPAIAASNGGASNGGASNGGASNGGASPETTSNGETRGCDAVDGDGSDALARNEAVASTFASWDEAEEVLDRMQLAGLLPCSYLDPTGAELRIIELDDRNDQSGRGSRAGGALGALAPGGSGQRAA